MLFPGLKINVAIFSALVFGILFFYFNSYTLDHMERTAEIQALLSELESVEYRINNELTENSYQLYTNYDHLENHLSRLNQLIARINRHEYLRSSSFQQTMEKLEFYERVTYEKEKNIQTFKTINSPIKNSLMYIGELVVEIQENRSRFENRDYLYRTALIASRVNLYKSTFDSDFARQLELEVKDLRTYRFPDRYTTEVNQLFLSHVSYFVSNYNKYVNYLNAAKSERSLELLSEAAKRFKMENRSATSFVTILSISFTLAFTLNMAVVVYLLLQVEKEKKILKDLKNRLEYSVRFDRLTGLLSRKSFELDLSDYKRPVVFLINIDGFKHINDFYGTAAGDYVLWEYARLLGQIRDEVQFPGTLYRLGADDFAFLCEEGNLDRLTGETDLGMELVLAVLEETEARVLRYEELSIPVHVTIGMGRGDRVLEKADMVLRYIKRGTRLRFLEYSESLRLEDEIHGNMEILRQIQEALETDGLSPFFQGIVDNRTGKIVRYESLARFRIGENNWCLPEGVFPVARETKLQSTITRVMVYKTMLYMEGNDLQCSLNLSVDDMEDEYFLSFLMGRLKANPDIASRLTFEILESESIKDYNQIMQFVRKVKALGCKIALDDFGSGYSNFGHVINLDLDYLKIDGSLIRNMDRDPNALMITRMLAELSRQAGIKTIAEYVHNQEIQDLVLEIGIDYSQGFHFQEPMQTPVPN